MIGQPIVEFAIAFSPANHLNLENETVAYALRETIALLFDRQVEAVFLAATFEVNTRRIITYDTDSLPNTAGNSVINADALNTVLDNLNVPSFSETPTATGILLDLNHRRRRDLTSSSSTAGILSTRALNISAWPLNTLSTTTVVAINVLGLIIGSINASVVLIMQSKALTLAADPIAFSLIMAPVFTALTLATGSESTTIDLVTNSIGISLLPSLRVATSPEPFALSVIGWSPSLDFGLIGGLSGLFGLLCLLGLFLLIRRQKRRAQNKIVPAPPIIELYAKDNASEDDDNDTELMEDEEGENQNVLQPPPPLSPTHTGEEMAVDVHDEAAGVVEKEEEEVVAVTTYDILPLEETNVDEEENGKSVTFNHGISPMVPKRARALNLAAQSVLMNHDNDDLVSRATAVASRGRETTLAFQRRMDLQAHTQKTHFRALRLATEARKKEEEAIMLAKEPLMVRSFKAKPIARPWWSGPLQIAESVDAKLLGEARVFIAHPETRGTPAALKNYKKENPFT